MSDGGGSWPDSGFLSDEWVAALTALVRAAPSPHVGDVGGVEPLRLGIRITGVPWAADRPFGYTVVIAESADVVVGNDEEADVVLVGPYEAARDLAEGRRTAADLLEAGSIKVGGDVARLLSAGNVLSLLTQGGRVPPATAARERRQRRTGRIRTADQAAFSQGRPGRTAP